MKHRERAAMTLERKIPDYVPTFELEYQLEDVVFGKKYLCENDLKGLSQKEKDLRLEENAEFLIQVYTELGYSILPIHGLSEENMMKTARLINQKTHDEFMLTAHGDGTFAIPDGNGMVEFVYWIYDNPEDGHAVARKNADAAIERNKKYIDAGFGSLILCSDYCFNQGPFVSPDMFEEFIYPYLHDICLDIRRSGGYAIKHTDGNIMPILDMLVAAEPHALHSLDPMAGVDIKEVKRLVGDKVALCGNVHCAALQTGTVEEVLESCKYAMDNGKPGGGYFFCTSNIPFRGLPPERYQLVLDFWKQNRYY